MRNVISDRSRDGNPNRLCLQAIQLCFIYEGTGRVTAEGIETITEQDEFLEFNPEFYDPSQTEYLTYILENISVLKCKVQMNNNIRLNNVSANVPID